MAPSQANDAALDVQSAGVDERRVQNGGAGGAALGQQARIANGAATKAGDIGSDGDRAGRHIGKGGPAIDIKIFETAAAAAAALGQCSRVDQQPINCKSARPNQIQYSVRGHRQGERKM